MGGGSITYTGAGRMTVSAKVAAFSITGGAVVAAIEFALLQSATTPGEIIGGGVTGGVVVGAIAWATYKAKVDEHGRRIEALTHEKADKDSVASLSKALDHIQADVTWLVRQKKGEQ